MQLKEEHRRSGERKVVKIRNCQRPIQSYPVGGSNMFDIQLTDVSFSTLFGRKIPTDEEVFQRNSTRAPGALTSRVIASVNTAKRDSCGHGNPEAKSTIIGLLTM
jgi:hypothetical protein